MAPAASSTGRWSPLATSQLGAAAGRGDGARSSASLRAIRAPAPSTSQILDTPEAIDMEEPAAAALRRKPRASIRLAAEAVKRGEAAALFSAGHTGASVMAAHARVRPHAGRRSSRARHDHSHPATCRRCCSTRARRSNAGRSTSCSLPSWGPRTRAWRSGVERAARRAAVGRRGRDEGERADARGAPAAEDRADRRSSATSRAGTSTPGRWT